MDDPVHKDVCDLHTKHYDTTLAQHEETIKQLTECTQKLTHIITTQEEKQKEIDKRLRTIERKPNVIIEKIILAGLTALVTVLVTLFFQNLFSGGT